MSTRHNSPWTKDLDNTMMFCLEVLGISYSAIAEILTREGRKLTKNACISRYRKLRAKGLGYAVNLRDLDF